MKRFKVCGEKVEIAESWFELTVEAWVKLMGITDKSSEVNLIAAFTGISVADLNKSKDTNIDLKVFAHTGWYSQPINFSDLKRGKTITVDGKTVNVPKDLGFKTLGQKIILQQKIKETEGSLSELIPYAFAVYIAPELYGKDYDLEGLDDFVDKFVNKLLIVEVFPIASFFLKKSIAYMSSRVKSYTEQQREIV